MSRRKHGLSACFPSTQRYCNGDKGLWRALAPTPSSVPPPTSPGPAAGSLLELPPAEPGWSRPAGPHLHLQWAQRADGCPLVSPGPAHPRHHAKVQTAGGRGGLPRVPHHPVAARRPRRLAWHGSTLRGGHAQRRDCQGWRSSGPGDGLAAPLAQGRLLAGRRHNCSEALVVLCVEVAFPYRHMW